MNFIIVLLFIWVTLKPVEGEQPCEVCYCRPFYTDCGEVTNRPVFDEMTAYNTETLVLNTVLFDTNLFCQID